jgi:5-methylcytosine-specific restriction endonuclease McrA
MPNKPPLACTAWPCGNVQPCPDHPRTYAQGYVGYRRNRPAGTAAMVRRVLARDPVCVICKAAPSVEVHHVIPRDDSSTVGTCVACHRRETWRYAAEMRRLNRP